MDAPGAPRGGIGTRGPGESQIETDRRLARDRIAALRRRLAGVTQARGVMRAERERARLPSVALAGYTNAGKSTLLAALTGAEAGVGDRLFHTLDPATRTMRHEGRDYLVTDTVGFIRKLPHQLVDAFGATLEETVRADLLLHVVDASAPAEEREAMMRAVDGVLEEIGATEAPRLLVLNKADALDPGERDGILLRHPGALLVSALAGEGIDELRDAVRATFDAGLRPSSCSCPTERARGSPSCTSWPAISTARTRRRVRVSARLPAALAARYLRFAVGNGAGPR